MEKSAHDRKLRQAIAVFFGDEGENSTESARETEKYIKMRIRSVMEIFIEEENTQNMEILEERGWLGPRELETYIKTAQELKKNRSLMWLLHLKNRKYGYEPEKFLL